MVTEERIDALVAGIFKEIRFQDEPRGLYDPLRYMIEIGGKRVRPRLCLTTYSFFSDDFGESILSPAAALEVFHSFTLMHDDIMDHSPMRRGMPTVWKKWGEDSAILSGDVMLIDSYRRISKAPHSALGKVMHLFSETSAKVCDGQQYDMEFESVEEVSMPEYDKMIGLKTAVLIACSAEMGAVIGGATEEQCRALYEYGYKLGMAFQVADDYLDTFGDEKVFGKPIGGDIVNGKKTWLTVRTLEKIADRQAFLEVFGRKAASRAEKDAKIREVRDIYVGNGVDADAKREIGKFTAEALSAAEGAGLGADNLEMLTNFANKLVGRAK